MENIAFLVYPLAIGILSRDGEKRKEELKEQLKEKLELLAKFATCGKSSMKLILVRLRIMISLKNILLKFVRSLTIPESANFQTSTPESVQFTNTLGKSAMTERIIKNGWIITITIRHTQAKISVLYCVIRARCLKVMKLNY